jgi:hypothetical protein
VGQHHFGKMRLEAARAKPERIISEKLPHLGWQETRLASRRKRDPCKLGHSGAPARRPSFRSSSSRLGFIWARRAASAFFVCFLCMRRGLSLPVKPHRGLDPQPD